MAEWGNLPNLIPGSTTTRKKLLTFAESYKTQLYFFAASPSRGEDCFWWNLFLWFHARTKMI